MAGNENSGRKPLLERQPEIMENILKVIRAGNYIKTACEYCGIDETTFYRYWNVGKEEIERGVTEDESVYVKFYKSVKKARAEAEVRNVSTINKASEKNWQASAWWLERSFPERYGRQTIDINNKHEGSIKHEHEGVVGYDEETKELLEKLYWKERELATGQTSDAD